MTTRAVNNIYFVEYLFNSLRHASKALKDMSTWEMNVRSGLEQATHTHTHSRW